MTGLLLNAFDVLGILAASMLLTLSIPPVPVWS